MATPESGDEFHTILDTRARSTQVSEYLVGAPKHNLATGSYYRFKVVAHNFNGASQASEIGTFRVCADPSGLAKPFKIATSISPTPSITIGWNAPTYTGGCPILGYEVYVDDGAGGTFMEANADGDPLVRDQPTLRQLKITRVTTIGATYRIQVRAYSETGAIISPILGTVLASNPLLPPVPVLRASSSTFTNLDISTFPASSNGGCEIVSFDI